MGNCLTHCAADSSRLLGTRRNEERAAADLQVLRHELCTLESDVVVACERILHELPGNSSDAWATVTTVGGRIDAVAACCVAGLRRAEEERVCVVCMAAPRTVLFLPCSHMAVCADCADSVDVCCICARAVVQRRFVFVS